MTAPTLHRQDNGARLAVLPSGHVIEELLNGGCLVVIARYGSVPCRETFVEALALFEGKKDEASAELKAARCVVDIAQQYREWILGGSLTIADKTELLQAMDAYDAVIGGSPCAHK